MGMKYYAKSKKNGLSDKERGKQIKEPEEEQKTLNSHQEDIVRCAEAFFEEYGRDFSEKEKRLVIESCRIHDWGKANLVFQAMINPDQSLLSGTKRKIFHINHRQGYSNPNRERSRTLEQ